MTNNQIQFAKLQEDRRHNLVSEGETGRHNVASEAVGRSQAGASWASVAEARRHNTAQEGINWYTAESIGRLQGAQTGYYGSLDQKTSSEIGLGTARLDEDTRHNLRTEEEALRHNVQTEGIGWMDARTRQDAAQAQAFKDYTQGAKNITGGIADVLKTVSIFGFIK